MVLCAVQLGGENHRSTPSDGEHSSVLYNRIEIIHQAAVAAIGKNHVRNGCTLFTKEDSAIRWRTPGKRMGRLASKAATEL